MKVLALRQHSVRDRQCRGMVFKKYLVSRGRRCRYSNGGNSLPSSGMTPPNRLGLSYAQEWESAVPKIAIRSISIDVVGQRARPLNLLPDNPLSLPAEIGGGDAVRWDRSAIMTSGTRAASIAFWIAVERPAGKVKREATRCHRASVGSRRLSDCP